MAWIYNAAYRAGDVVNVRLTEPSRQMERWLPSIWKQGRETEAAFVERAQGEIAGYLRNLNAQLANEADVTNTFRPPQAEPGGGSHGAADAGRGG